jgi:hypothetical protein
VRMVLRAGRGGSREHLSLEQRRIRAPFQSASPFVGSFPSEAVSGRHFSFATEIRA